MTRTSAQRIAAPIAAFAALTLLAGCTAGGDGDGSTEKPDKIVFWTPQTTPERLAAQEKVAEGFTEKTGIKVDVVPMAGADQDQALGVGEGSAVELGIPHRDLQQLRSASGRRFNPRLEN